MYEDDEFDGDILREIDRLTDGIDAGDNGGEEELLDEDFFSIKIRIG